MKTTWQQKISQAPNQAGVYYHLDSKGVIIYVGKAVNLRRRLSNYLTIAETGVSGKDRRLGQAIADSKWSVVANGFQALLLESEMIKRYQPKFNVLQRDSNSFDWYYVCFDFNKTHPHLFLSRDLAEVSALESIGPYVNSRSLRQALKYLRKSFPYSQHRKMPAQVCLDYHLGLCLCPAASDFDPQQARLNLRRLKLCLAGKQARLMRQLKQEMHVCAGDYQYEQAARLRNQILALEDFRQSIIFDDLEEMRPDVDQALLSLQKLFNLEQYLERIEAYDISHLAGNYTTASMVVAHHGVIAPHLSRRFKALRAGNNDFAQIKAVLLRRFNSKHLRHLPDLLLIDGGIPQISAAEAALAEVSLRLPAIALAKREELIVFKTEQLSINQQYLKQLAGKMEEKANFSQLRLSRHSHVLKLLQRLRDASHRLALNYQGKLHRQAQTSSPLLALPGIGPITYGKLMKHFGSYGALQRADREALCKVINSKQARVILDYFKSQ